MAQSYLSDLAFGLRQAAGVLNPDIQKQTFAADEREKSIEQQFLLQQMTPQAQMARLQLQNELGFRKEIQSLSPDDENGMALAAVKHGKPEIALQMWKNKEDRALRLHQLESQVELKKQTLEQTHSVNLLRIGMMGDAEQRKVSEAAEKARHNREVESNSAASNAIRQQLADLKATAERVLPPKVMTDLVEAGKTLDASERFVSNFKDNYGGFVSDTVGFTALAAEKRLSSTTDRVQWWQDYDMHQNVIRNKLFGSALTVNEQKIWERSAVTPGMNAEQIKTNLKTRENLERTGFTRLARTAGTQYNKRSIEEAIGRPIPEAGGITTIRNDEEYNALPSGAEFIDPNGVKRRKP